MEHLCRQSVRLPKANQSSSALIIYSAASPPTPPAPHPLQDVRVTQGRTGTRAERGPAGDLERGGRKQGRCSGSQGPVWDLDRGQFSRGLSRQPLINRRPLAFPRDKAGLEEAERGLALRQAGLLGATRTHCAVQGTTLATGGCKGQAQGPDGGETRKRLSKDLNPGSSDSTSCSLPLKLISIQIRGFFKLRLPIHPTTGPG